MDFVRFSLSHCLTFPNIGIDISYVYLSVPIRIYEFLLIEERM